MQTEQRMNIMTTERRIDTQGLECRTPADRKKERDQLARVVSAWVSAGNKITKVPFGLGVRSPDSLWAREQRMTIKQKRSRQ